MPANGRHKRWLSILMLVLYGFIITPVALWHSHACDGRSKVCKQAGGEDAPGSDEGDACPICHHVYASHIAGEELRFETSSVAFRLYDASFRKNIPFIFTGHADTRGSPAPVACS